MNASNIRLLGYYNFPNQVMKPESELVEEANEMAPLLSLSIQSLMDNPNTDEELKQVIQTPTVFVFKNEEGKLIAYYTKDKIVRLTNVVYNRNDITQVPLKYKSWFLPGQPIIVKAGNNKDIKKDNSVKASPNTKRERVTAKSVRGGRRVDDEVISKIKTRLRLRNNYFIGQFSPERTEGWYKITDIRDTGFTKIEDKERGVKDLSITFPSPNKEFNRFAYYKFSWVLLGADPLKFGINFNEEVTPIYPKDIVTCLHDTIVNYDASSSKKITRTLDTLNKQLTQSGKEVFIYELLQNANDYPRKQKKGSNIVPVPVDVEFHITDEILTFQHTGDYFNAKNIAAICDINDGEKSDNIEAIGYKGIGFKTVFLDNDYVYLSTGNYSFRFDKSATDIINTPWQILPVWTEYREVPLDVRKIFRRHPNEEFRVKFALKPRDKKILTDRSRKDNYIDLFSSVFETERVILFIPNIRKVSVFIGDSEETLVEREKNNDCWCVSRAMTDDVPPHVRERINEVLTNPDADKSDGYEKIPEKYYDFFKTTVKFACKKQGRSLQQVDDAILYCYLPAKRADWGFKFLMNTDMLPNGARDDIEDIELNHEISKIAGKQFFNWIKELIACKEYELDSIFNLIPDFDKCKEKRIEKSFKTFIDEFKTEFESLIKKEPFVPVIDKDGNESLACIDCIIDDLTGITEKNVMSDSDFITLMGMDEYCLPIQELRQSKCFMKFMYKYCPAEMDIDFDDVKKKISEDNFQTWLKEIENNTKFISHLLDKKELKSFSSKSIFIEYENDLYKADELYYDFDTEGATISFLKIFVPHLCDETRTHFMGNEDWDSFVDNYFMDFDAESIVNNCIVDNSEAIELLKLPNNSVNFFKFVAEKEIDLSDKKNIVPYITEDGDAITDYNGYLYLYNEDAYRTSKESWIEDVAINILSHIYLENDDENKVKLLFEGLGFSSFTKEGFISSVIADDTDFRDSVNEGITDNFDKNVAFVRYVFSCKDSLKEKNLIFKEYVLCCIDIKGEECYLSNDDLRYFNQQPYAGNSTFEENKSHEWISSGMMYCLNPKYFSVFDESESKSLESFFRQQFGIKTFTDKSFFTDVVLKNKKEIYASLTDKNKMLVFISYLQRDNEHIFDGTVTYNEFNDMPLLCSDGTVITKREEEVKLVEFNDQAVSLYNKNWCPEVFKVMDEVYSTAFSQDIILRYYNIGKFEINAILSEIINEESIKTKLADADMNVDFWRWIKANMKALSSFDELKTLSLLDSENKGCRCASLYISDTYQKDGIESLVKKYDEEASFVSDIYLEDDTEANKTEWLKLFKKLGLKSDNKDILFNSVLPNLSSFEEDSVVVMMSKHIKDLKDVWDERKEEITKLRVRTKGNSYKALDDVLIIDIQEETVVEPFKYITLSDEVASDILSNNKELLRLVAKECSNHRSITSKKEWAEEKIKEYIDIIQDDEEKRISIHVDFVRELAKLSVDYSIDVQLLDKILYLVKAENVIVKAAKDITLGSAYSPICDFESNGVTELDYLSEDYIFEGNRDIIKSFFKSRGLHHTMTEDDIKHLSNRAFALYFWSYCFSKKITEYEDWISRGLFNDKVCIPTETSVKKPEDLYYSRMWVYASKSDGWTERVPSKSIIDKFNHDTREIFDKLPFNPKLSFKECINYLLKANDRSEDETSRRKEICNWILEADDIDTSLIEEYRNNPNALWRNCKWQKKHIKELYVIHPDAKQYREIFHGNEFVMLTNMFPLESSEFERLCSILGLKCLNGEDFVSTPINKVDQTAEMMKMLKPRILVLSAIENTEKYKDKYKKYDEIISNYRFYVCDEIDLGYDTIHNDVERIYEDNSHLYYVSSWQHPRTFIRFCSKIKNLLGISVNDNVIEDVFEDKRTMEQNIEKYCAAFLHDEDFRNYLENLDCSVAVEIGEEPESADEKYYKDEKDVIEESPGNEESSEQKEDNLMQSKKKPDEKQNEEEKADMKGDISNEENEPSNQEHEEPLGAQTNDEKEDGINLDDDIVSKVEEEKKGEEVKEDIEETPQKQEDNKGIPREQENGSSNLGTPKAEKNEFDKEKKTEQKQTQRIPDEYVFIPDDIEPYVPDPDDGEVMGDVSREGNYEPVGARPNKPFRRKVAKMYTKEELNRLRSNGTPLELESLPPTKEEIDILAQCGISVEQIADTNHLAQLRFYNKLVREGETPEESMEEFIMNAADVAIHKIRGGKFIHTCSAARGVMYISPSVWNKMVDNQWRICVYLDGRGKDFYYIDTDEEFLRLVEKDDVVIKITGKEKVKVVRQLYTGLLKDVKGTAYTLIRVASRTNMDAVFAHYVGAMAEAEDGNDTNEY